MGITDTSLNIYSFIGILLLMGIVKKNSILLVDFTNHKREEGHDVNTALIEACPVRLRPILMTSIATIAGALPAALTAATFGVSALAVSALASDPMKWQTACDLPKNRSPCSPAPRDRQCSISTCQRCPPPSFVGFAGRDSIRSGACASRWLRRPANGYRWETGRTTRHSIRSATRPCSSRGHAAVTAVEGISEVTVGLRNRAHPTDRRGRDAPRELEALAVSLRTDDGGAPCLVFVWTG